MATLRRYINVWHKQMYDYLDVINAAQAIVSMFELIIQA